MSKDTIYREAAIDAIERESQVDGAYGYMDTKSIIDVLEDLPSAQSESKSYRMGYQAGYAAAQRWTPVTEKPPSKPGNYLVTVSRMIGNYVKSEFFDGDDFDDWDEEVRAWMPLPAPYRPEGEKE